MKVIGRVLKEWPLDKAKGPILASIAKVLSAQQKVPNPSTNLVQYSMNKSATAFPKKDGAKVLHDGMYKVVEGESETGKVVHIISPTGRVIDTRHPDDVDAAIRIAKYLSQQMFSG